MGARPVAQNRPSSWTLPDWPDRAAWDRREFKSRSGHAKSKTSMQVTGAPTQESSRPSRHVPHIRFHASAAHACGPPDRSGGAAALHCPPRMVLLDKGWRGEGKTAGHQPDERRREGRSPLGLTQTQALALPLDEVPVPLPDHEPAPTISQRNPRDLTFPSSIAWLDFLAANTPATVT